MTKLLGHTADGAMVLKGSTVASNASGRIFTAHHLSEGRTCVCDESGNGVPWRNIIVIETVPHENASTCSVLVKTKRTRS